MCACAAESLPRNWFTGEKHIRMKIRLPENVRTIIETLESCGHEAYAVGGCVRDSILGKTPADWDITTSALPEQVKKIFPRTVDTGIAHGTVTVLLRGGSYEVTTYRIDGAYEDARHPSEVSFTSNLLEDLRRRDFTINAMAYNERSGLVDAYDGIQDLKDHRIRCVGDPMERFSEDALRMLRAVRFCAQLGFSMEEGTRAAITELAPTIAKVSAERISVELVKLLVSDHPEMMEQVYETGLSAVILPELDEMMKTDQHCRHHCYPVGKHTMEALRWTPKDKVTRLAVFLHDVAKPASRTTDSKGWDHFYGHPERGAEMAGQILRRLKFDNDTIYRVKALVGAHDKRPEATGISVRRAVVEIGQDAFPRVFDVKRADVMAQSCYCRKEKLQEIAAFEQLYHRCMEQKECLSIRELQVDGKDVMDLGIGQGKAVGAVLKHLLDWVLEDPDRNQRSLLLEEAKRYKLENPDI